MKLNENLVIALLMRNRSGTGFAMPRYTPSDWWECDVCWISPNKVMHEYEIKLSRSDFFNDAKKQTGGYARPVERKHDLLRNGDARAPGRFWYVVPEGMITRGELPAFAGLVQIVHVDRSDTPAWNCPLYWNALRYHVKAPILHRGKVSDQRIRALQRTGFYRMRNLLEDRFNRQFGRGWIKRNRMVEQK